MQISLDQVRFSFPNRHEQGLNLFIPSFRLPNGTQASLMGESGSGKSTLLNLIAGFLKPKEGVVEVSGHELQTLSESERDRIRRNHIGVVFQTYQLLEGFSVEENVLMGAQFSKTGQVDAALVEHLLEKVGLGGFQKRFPKELSVGQRQRVAITRALIKKPSLILADEPTGALDQKNGMKICELLQELSTEQGSSLLFVTHDEALASSFTEQLHTTDILQWEKGGSYV